MPARSCYLCRFVAEMDDQIVVFTSGKVICLRCYLRETDTSRRMTVELRHDIEDVMRLAGLNA